MKTIDPRTDMQGWLRQRYLLELRELRETVRRYPAHSDKGCLLAGEHVYQAIQDLIERADEVQFGA